MNQPLLMMTNTSAPPYLSLVRRMEATVTRQFEKVGMFSVQTDSTQDITTQDQCSVMSLNIHERLVAVVCIHKAVLCPGVD